ncbi:MAG: hypothetical protein KJO07_25390 [Deltaproteobacteria bacterium]|nr:hypothetical protein [Deltaproteobacteria bacterium]
MSKVLLAIRDVGLAMPLQDALESGGHQVVWKAEAVDGPIEGATSADVIVVSSSDAHDLSSLVAQYRQLDPVPAVVAIGSGDDAATAREARTSFVDAAADPAELSAAIAHALKHRFAAGLSLALARGALSIEPLGSRSDQIVQVVRESRTADISLVQEALRWYPQHYVCATDLVPSLREARALQVPEIEICKLCDGSMTLQTLVRTKHLPPGPSAALIWALASVGAVTLTPEPPDPNSRRRRAVIMARRHLQARRDRLSASTYYDVLELPPSCEIDAIEGAFQLLATRYSPEALGNLDLAKLRELAEPVWNQILKARQALSDWATRGRYNDWLQEHFDSLTSEWATGDKNQERAEDFYARGQKALVEGDSHGAVSNFAGAARAYPGHPDYECSLLWARFRSDIERGHDRATRARELRAEAETFNVGRRPWPRALVALALLCAADGDSGAARWHAHEALTINPRLPAARRLWKRLGGDG